MCVLGNDLLALDSQLVCSFLGQSTSSQSHSEVPYPLDLTLLLPSLPQCPLSYVGDCFIDVSIQRSYVRDCFIDVSMQTELHNTAL